MANRVGKTGVEWVSVDPVAALPPTGSTRFGQAHLYNCFTVQRMILSIRLMTCSNMLQIVAD